MTLPRLHLCFTHISSTDTKCNSYLECCVIKTCSDNLSWNCRYFTSHRWRAHSRPWVLHNGQLLLPSQKLSVFLVIELWGQCHLDCFDPFINNCLLRLLSTVSMVFHGREFDSYLVDVMDNMYAGQTNELHSRTPKPPSLTGRDLPPFTILSKINTWEIRKAVLHGMINSRKDAWMQICWRWC